MHDVPPTSSVFRHSYQVLLCSSGPCSYIIHPVDPRSSPSLTSRNRALDDLFFKHDPSFLMMCPKYFIFLSFTIPSNFLPTPAFSSTHLFVFPSTIFALSFLNISSRTFLFSSPRPSSLSSLRIRILQPAI